MEEYAPLIEIHKQGIVVCSLLGGFTMSGAYAAYTGDWKTKTDKTLAPCLLISSVFFICTVCIAALLLFIVADYERPRQLPKFHGDIVENLSKFNLVTGSIGMLFLFLSLGAFGWEKGKTAGLLTTIVATVGFIVMMCAIWTVYKTYMVPNYGEFDFSGF